MKLVSWVDVAQAAGRRSSVPVFLPVLGGFCGCGRVPSGSAASEALWWVQWRAGRAGSPQLVLPVPWREWGGRGGCVRRRRDASGCEDGNTVPPGGAGTDTGRIRRRSVRVNDREAAPEGSGIIDAHTRRVVSRVAVLGRSSMGGSA